MVGALWFVFVSLVKVLRHFEHSLLGSNSKEVGVFMNGLFNHPKLISLIPQRRKKEAHKLPPLSTPRKYTFFIVLL